ncbi:Chemotaxis protein methyltransferase CheR [[Actinomadura] parvosata subsp. kistnae]|uniref:protein-glutamate O-methyltransferase n=1 Tax=[Actinomadura] parvosata subsp. kistnae TaxID=1909395 RepID=A0A1V0AD14_9ACTN|nr:CheR family methyltransferase [Nonomuraea sp. ATCC 55076]AQZ68114.1 chemotaxis protein CheR [Nonomuraea sp. ATCC 55076]SPL93502.1 Chemotaxis protein methyltransferase CheR [Actinomadura parvosata subsp. kistnae]
MTTEEEREFDDLLLLLKETRGFDFTGYKRNTLIRRIARRLEALKLHDYGEYRDLLELEPEEFTRLFDSLLINVTSFFRDAAAWQRLRELVIPALLDQKPAGQPIRIWSAGCATGEEAYTIAMVLAEELGMDGFRDRVKIYGTDLDEKALHVARTGVYNDRALADVPIDLREAYFERVENGYTFRRDLRRQLIFGRNDLTHDAPISRVDLLLARNTLMYFNTEMQLNIIRRFHFALSDPGFLFLGKAEMLLNHSDKFEPVDLRMRLFRKIRPANHGNRAPWSVTGAATDLASRLPTLASVALASGPVAQLVVDVSGNLALANSKAEALFNLNPRDVGRPFQDLEVSYRPVELRSVIEQARHDLRPVELQDVVWHRVGSPEPSVFDVSVVPLLASGNLVGMGIHFYDVTRYRKLRDELEQANRQLEQAYEELQSLNEELETTNEELQSTNEELETTNEELQSTNEELETMNEELQSTNDELQHINDALTARTIELDEVNRFVSSVVRSLGDAVVVLDDDLRVVVWSPGAEELWGVRSDEAVGEPLAGLDIGLPLDLLLPRLRAALANGTNPLVEVEGLVLDAVNRRGRPAPLTVQLSHLRTEDDTVHGLIMVMNVVNSDG